ncbi:MAG: dioxygenase [Aeromicrobium sp.]
MAFATEDNITDLAVERWATAKDPRLAELMTGLVTHLHDFAREVRLTEEEWITAMGWLAATGQISDEKREEFILASDVLGLSMLVVQMNNRFAADATPATVLGPFHIDGSPTAPYGWDMSDGIDGTPFFITGTVRSTTGEPVPHAVLDVWQADADGNYEAQLGIEEARLRAKYQAREDGTYCLRSIVPRGYAIPMDGPVGDLISRTEISYFRPAHIHFLFEEAGYERLVTHLFAEGTQYLDDDVVFGTKAELITRFVQHDGGAAPDGTVLDRPFVTAEYDFSLQPVG